MTALGYIELNDGASRFIPVVRPARMVALIGTVAVAVALVARGVSEGGLRRTAHDRTPRSA